MGSYLSMEQLAYYAQGAGFRGDALRNIIAIAWAESGGQIDAIGDGGNSFGLLQIHAPSHPGVDTNRLRTDPLYAFQQAYRISGNGSNFNPWTTWSHATAAGKEHNAQQFLASASEAVSRFVSAIDVGGGSFDLTPRSAPAGGVSSAAATTGGGGGYGASALPADPLPPDATPEQITDYIKKHYPQAAALLNIEEIRNILVRPDIDEMDAIEIQALLQNTNYWKTTNPDARTYDILKGQDPAAADQLLQRAKNTVGDLFAQNGITLDDATLSNVADNVIRRGWINTAGGVVDANSIQDFMAFVLGKEGKAFTGTAGATVDALGAKAKEYGLTLARTTLEEWTMKIMQGQTSEEGFTNYLAGRARELYNNDPDLVSAIDGGISPKAFFDAHRQAIASALELSPEQVDLFNDPRWRDVTQHYDPALNGGKGGRRSMTVGEAAQMARNRPEYTKTAAYRQTQAQAGQELAAFVGKVK
jgi:hypothetical protein